MLTKNSNVCTVLEISRETVSKIKSFTKEQQKCCNNMQMVEYNNINVKLSDSQLNELKGAVKNKQGRT